MCLVGVYPPVTPLHEASMEFSGNDVPHRPNLLDPEVAQVLRLYFDHELSLREIAVELGISPSEGRELLTRGMRHLDRAPAGDDDGTLGVS
jgi:DNA-directed RNA polymerase specialized sigma24 family protein